MTMLRATQWLIEQFRSSAESAPRLVEAHLRVIRGHGSLDDARALLGLFLEAPQDFWRRELLQVVEALGDRGCADILAKECFNRDGLREGVPGTVLRTIGYLGLPEAESLLAREVLEANPDATYDREVAAVLGLLHFPCERFRSSLVERIRSTFGENTFCEMLPALTCKTGGEVQAEALWILGSTTASTDCNGGIVLGLALLGEDGASLFRQALDDPYWEAFGGGTGADYWAYVGMCAQAVTFGELATAIKADAAADVDEAHVCHKLKVLGALLHHRLADEHLPLAFIRRPTESFACVYRSLYSWGDDPNRDASIRGIADQYRVAAGIHELEHLLAVRLEQEVATETLGDDVG